MTRPTEPSDRVNSPYPPPESVVKHLDPAPMNGEAHEAALEGTCTVVTLAPTHLVGLSDDAAAAATRKKVRHARVARVRRRAWWQWLDFDSKLLAQVWLICCSQIVILVISGLVIHASSASPY